ncbi:MAG: sigma-70 family RNA polymerase sigma factor [Planctomycetes bacterium]|nr:sigma-70 family RNA polymerase sigma factor [Planctomycetota bacterium]MCP4838206.1 sigma-70 family RNA polymerase sigma factor [Planctomycetota bacterium]
MPSNPHETDITTLLNTEGTEQAAALDRVAAALMNDLRRIAGAHFSHEHHQITLQPTVIVNEAWMRLTSQERCQWQNRKHFLSVASIAMRRLLVDHARKRNSLIRGGDKRRVHLTASHASEPDSSVEFDLEALSLALDDLDALDPELARIVDLRFLAGLTVEQVAEATGLSPATVKRRWAVARGWLRDRLESPDG